MPLDALQITVEQGVEVRTGVPGQFTWLQAARRFIAASEPLTGHDRTMEAFESFVALTMEDEGLVVSEAIKFPVTRRTAKTAYAETQTHGFEVDLIGACADRLVLATVKSFFGSTGIVAEHVMGLAAAPRLNNLYALLNDSVVRDAVMASAGTRYVTRLTKSRSGYTSVGSPALRQEPTSAKSANGARTR